MTRIGHIGGLSAVLAMALSSVPGLVVSAEAPTASSHPAAKRADAMAADRLRAQQRRADAERERLAWAARLVRWKYPKPGHSVKQGQRMARKARNRKRAK